MRVELGLVVQVDQGPGVLGQAHHLAADRHLGIGGVVLVVLVLGGLTGEDGSPELKGLCRVDKGNAVDRKSVV